MVKVVKLEICHQTTHKKAHPDDEHREYSSLGWTFNIEIKSRRKLLSFEDATNHKPRMNKERSEQPVMGAHHLEALAKRSTMVLHRHTSIEIMGDDSTHIAQWQVKPCRLFHHTYAPVYIGRETIIEIIMDAFCQVGTGIE